MTVLQPVFSMGRYLNKKKKKTIPRNIYSPPAPDFFIYSGPRWFLPPRIKISQSIRNKFNSLVTIFNFKQIRKEISKHISMTGFYFPGYKLDKSNSYVINEIKEWIKVKYIYSKLFCFRRNLLALIFRWQIHKCIKNIKNTEDPVTLEIPKKPVYVIDFVNRSSFIYEASTLRRTIQDRILLSDHMFPMPKKPVNILTNKEFTFNQLYSIIRQCKNYGETSWVFESLMDLSGNYARFLTHNKQALKLKAISNFFDNSSHYVIRETIVDYFTHEAESVSLNEATMTSFINCINTSPELPIVKKWIHLTKQYYLAIELQDSTILSTLGLNIHKFFSRITMVLTPNLYQEPSAIMYILFRTV